MSSKKSISDSIDRRKIPTILVSSDTDAKSMTSSIQFSSDEYTRGMTPSSGLMLSHDGAKKHSLKDINISMKNTMFRSPSFFFSSDEVNEMCDACKTGENKDKDASFYCKECSEFLCGECREFHKKVTLTRKHNVCPVDDDFRAEQIRRKQNQISPRSPKRTHTPTSPNQINVSLEDDENVSDVMSIVVIEKFLYIADNANGKVKLFYSENGVFVCQTSVPNVFGLAAINEASIAVTHGMKTIHILTYKDKTLNIFKKLKTSMNNFGIRFYNDELYLLCKDVHNRTDVTPQIDVIALDGTPKRLLKPTFLRAQVFKDPVYIAVNQTTGAIYITDWLKGVIALKPTGKVEFIEQLFSEVETASGLAIDEQGDVYVCGLSTDNLMKMSPDGKRSNQVLGGVQSCFSVAVREDKLYLSCRDSDIIEIHKLTSK